MRLGKVRDAGFRVVVLITAAVLLANCVYVPASNELTKPIPPPVRTEIDGGNYKEMPFACGGQMQVLRLRLSPPKWPASAPETLESGHVTVQFVVNEFGKPEALSAVQASDPSFIEPALTVVRRAQFEFDAALAPCVVGKTLQLPLRFQLR